MKSWGVGLLLLVVSTITGSAGDPCNFVLQSQLLSSNRFRVSLIGESDTVYSLETSSDLQNWVASGNGSNGGFTRTISMSTSPPAVFYRAVRGPSSQFVGAVVARETFDPKGNIILTDSYDSMDPLHSANGLYDPATRKAGGHIYAGGVSNVLDLGNITAYGRIELGPGVSYSTGPNFSAGDLDWLGPGIEPGWLKVDFLICWPDVNPPGSSIPPSGIGTNVLFLPNGNFKVNGDISLRSSENIYVQGNATLWVTGNLNMIGTSAILFGPGASLKLFIGGPSASIGFVSGAESPLAFQVYGLPSATSIAWVANADYKAVLYAPAATVTLGGGGNTTYDYQGGLAAKSVNLNGHFSVHFDEALRRTFVR